MSCIPSNGQNPYLISVGKDDQPRASGLNGIFDPSSKDFFPFDKVKDGDKILFAGCGNGQLVVDIVKKLDRRDLTIVAFDISQKQLDCAREYAFNEGVTGIDWRLQDIHHLDGFKGQFNVVHARFILNHLTDAKAVTQELCKTIARGGIFIGEECSGYEVDTSFDTEEYVEAVRGWEQMVILQHAKQHSDIAFAAKMPRILEKAGMLVKEVRKPNPEASTLTQKNVLPASLVCAPGIFSAFYLSSVPSLQATLEKIRDSDECKIIFKAFTQIHAEKAPSSDV